jgi:hypothetical protein
MSYYLLKSLAYSHTKEAVMYADSIIKTAKKLQNEAFLAKGYLQKGIQLYCHAQHKEALDFKSLLKDKSLGQWVGKQRTFHDNNKLLEDRKDLLDEIGFFV